MGQPTISTVPPTRASTAGESRRPEEAAATSVKLYGEGGITGAAGATLFATWASSVLGVLVYSLMPGPANASPDWALGALYGLEPATA